MATGPCPTKPLRPCSGSTPLHFAWAKAAKISLPQISGHLAVNGRLVFKRCKKLDCLYGLPSTLVKAARVALASPYTHNRCVEFNCTPVCIIDFSFLSAAL